MSSNVQFLCHILVNYFFAQLATCRFWFFFGFHILDIAFWRKAEGWGFFLSLSRLLLLCACQSQNILNKIMYCANKNSYFSFEHEWDTLHDYLLNSI